MYCKPYELEEQYPWVQGKENADKLWALSEQMVGEKFEV